MRLLFLVFLLCSSCSATSKVADVIAVDDALPTATLSSVGMDTTYLNNVDRKISQEKKHKIHSMLVARNGKLVFEKYYNGFGRNNPHDLRSATKSITSLLTGIAVEKGLLSGVDEPMMTHLKGDYPAINDKDEILLKHLLTMRSGLDCHDGDRKTRGQEDRMYRSRDWVDYFLSLSNTYAPGDSTRYCTGGVVALGEVIAQAAKQDFAQYADHALFEPLGITNYRWARFDDEKKVDTGGHLMLTPQGMVKIGMLVAQKGKWAGNQIVPQQWVEESTQKHTAIDGNPYGYLWWINEPQFGDEVVEIISARGNGGQVIFVVPDFDLVTVFTAGYYNSDQTRVVYDIFFNAVLPSLNALKPYFVKP